MTMKKMEKRLRSGRRTSPCCRTSVLHLEQTTKPRLTRLTASLLIGDWKVLTHCKDHITWHSISQSCGIFMHSKAGQSLIQMWTDYVSVVILYHQCELSFVIFGFVYKYIFKLYYFSESLTFQYVLCAGKKACLTSITMLPSGGMLTNYIWGFTSVTDP